MSIYSGFPTRKDQNNYNQLLAKLIQLMQAHLLELIPLEKVENTKVTSYARIISRMQQYEQHKYLPPKFSELLTPLASIIGIPTKLQQSNLSSLNGFSSTKQKQKRLNSNSPSFPSTHYRQESESRFRGDKDSLGQTNIRRFSKMSKNSQGVSFKKQRNPHGSFYQIQEMNLKKMQQRYRKRTKQINSKIESEPEQMKLKYRSQTESPGQIYKQFHLNKYDPADKYSIIHLKALKQAQQQLKQSKMQTPKRTQMRIDCE